MQFAMQDEARQRVEEYRARQRETARANRLGEDEGDDDFDDDEYDVEVEYAP
jgi:GTP-binding protein